jgi:hypothetical protein
MVRRRMRMLLLRVRAEPTCNWGQTGLVIDRPERALLTLSGPERLSSNRQSPPCRSDLFVHKRLDCLSNKGGEFLMNRELADGQFNELNVRKTS